MGNRKSSVTWPSEDFKKGLESYTSSRLMSGGIPELIRAAVLAYIKQRKPSENSEAYNLLKGYIDF